LTTSIVLALLLVAATETAASGGGKMSKLRNFSRGGWIVVGLATFAATVLPVASASATASTSVRSTPTGTLLATLSDPAATAGDQFGNPVAVSGATAVIGAHGTSGYGGVAYIYVKGASGWPTKPTATLSDPAATTGDYFGSSVAVSGETAVVGRCLHQCVRRGGLHLCEGRLGLADEADRHAV
jgi:hypothetical protein